MDKAKRVGSLTPTFVNDGHNQTTNTSSPAPLMVTPVPTVSPMSTTTSPLLMATPFGAMIPPNNNSYAADAGPSTGLVKRGRGRPKGSKSKHPTTKKKFKANDPNNQMVTPNFNLRITERQRQNGNQELTDSVLMRFDAARRRLRQIKCMDHFAKAHSNCITLGVRTNMKRRIGPVPGVQVGDIFYFRGEMILVGLHLKGIDGIGYLTVKESAREGPLATSVVTSKGKYGDETEEVDTLVYTGEGSKAKDQKLIKGNLALQASKYTGKDVRVIRCLDDPNDESKKVYVYDGLYSVVDYWKDEGKHGFDEFKFRLVRKLGQPSGYATWKLTESWRKYGLDGSRKGLILQDLSSGAESLRVPLVNEVDVNDKNPCEGFLYITSVICGLDLNLEPPDSIGCGECNGILCSDEDQKCVCVRINGGELPYNNRILVSRKPMVYECGEACPCVPYCQNRVVQSGLKLRVEVFKTEKCGWGLRSWDPIRAGTFICEFAGLSMVKGEEEVDDDYLFDSSRVSNRFKWNFEPELAGDEGCEPQVSEDFELPWKILISAKEYGNVGRFINHSCSPNVMWQPVECEENGMLCIRVGFFAKKHIPPMTELRYDYGMSCVAEEASEDGTRLFKGKKVCLCGSVKCLGSFS